jgi:hypothetical protein
MKSKTKEAQVKQERRAEKLICQAQKAVNQARSVLGPTASAKTIEDAAVVLMDQWGPNTGPKALTP